MDYCIVQDGMIANMLICENDEIAKEFGAVPSYEEARIGGAYNPPPLPEPPPTELEQLRADVDFLAAMQGVSL